MEENNVNLSAEETKEEVSAPAEPIAEGQTEQPKKEEPWKKLLKSPLVLAAGALVVLILVFAILGSAFSTADFVTAEAGIAYVELSESEYLIIFDSKNQVKLTDVQLTAVSPMNDAVLYTNEDGALYYLAKGKKEGVKIADEAEDAVFSVDGKRFVYTVEAGSEEEEGTKMDLYVVESGKKEGKLVANDVTRIVLSPDFKSFYYACDDEHYLYNGGKSQSVSIHEDYRVLGISNKAKYVYTMKSEYLEEEERNKRTLYVQKGFEGERVKLADDFQSGMYAFNIDGTEIYYEVDEAAYLSVKGEKAEKVMNQSTSNVLNVPNAATTSYAVRAMPFVTFVGRQMVGGNDGLYTIGKNSSETVKIASGIDRAVLSEDGKSVVYSKNGELYRIKDLSSENDSTKIEMDLEIESWKTSPDLEKIYILTVDGDLYYVKGSGTPKKIEGGSDVTRFYLSGDGKICYAEKDDEWYYCSNGGKLKRISGIDEKADLQICVDFVVLKTEEAVYISKGDGKFEKIGDIDFPEEESVTTDEDAQ